jgi:hypothetical protein
MLHFSIAVSDNDPHIARPVADITACAVLENATKAMGV